MSVLKNAGNLVLGNGDIFINSNISLLPTVAAYKAALAAGTLVAMAGNVGAIKATVSCQIIRELVAFEVGVPQEVADQTVIREGIHIKCALAELSLANIAAQIGGGVYATTSAGPALAPVQLITLSNDAGSGEPIAMYLAHSPVLFMGSTPAAPANPLVNNVASGGIPGPTLYTIGVDYNINPMSGTIERVNGGAIADGGEVAVTYYYQSFNYESLTVGGQSLVNTVALQFYHPYKDGRVLGMQIFKANPIGTVTMPFEEIAYSNTDLEFKGIADFTRPAGANLVYFYREIAA